MINTSQKGFTLIELLVVVLIITLMAGVGLVSYRNSLAAGRDARRQTDMESIKQAMILYRTQFGIYPESLNSNARQRLAEVTDVLVSQGYLEEAPIDPLNGQGHSQYWASRVRTDEFTICATLESSGTNYCVENP